MTNKKNETVHLVEQGLTWEQIQEWSRDTMSDHSLDWLVGNKESIEWNSAQPDILAASDLSDSDAPFCLCDLDFFFLWDFWPFTLHALSVTLHMASWVMV